MIQATKAENSATSANMVAFNLFSNKISNHEWTKIVFSPFVKEKFKRSHVYNCRRVLSFDSLDHFESNEQNLPMNQNTAGFSPLTTIFTAILTKDV